MVGAGIIVDLLFGAFRLIPNAPRPASALMEAHPTWNYTTWLDFVALTFGTVLVWMHFRAGPRPHKVVDETSAHLGGGSQPTTPAVESSR